MISGGNRLLIVFSDVVLSQRKTDLHHFKPISWFGSSTHSCNLTTMGCKWDPCNLQEVKHCCNTLPALSPYMDLERPSKVSFYVHKIETLNWAV